MSCDPINNCEEPDIDLKRFVLTMLAITVGWVVFSALVSTAFPLLSVVILFGFLPGAMAGIGILLFIGEKTRIVIP